MGKIAFVVGASGSVGEALIKELEGSDQFSKIVSFGRKRLGLQKAEEVIIPMDVASLEDAVLKKASSIEGEIVGFSVLGVGANTAKLSIDEHRAVDVELNRAFANGLKKSGKSRHLNFMSAVGSNPNASTRGSGAAGMPRYSRVKGESEEAVKSVGLEIVSIFRPAMIIGSKHTPWIAEKFIPLFSWITPKKFLSIQTSEIAKAMVACGVKTPAKSGAYHYPEMMNLISGVNPF